MENLGSLQRPLRIAIIGSGPAGFYAAEALLTAPVKVKVDVFDHLPAPFGLVRYGVAPDHLKIKNVIKIYEKTAAHEAFSFLGNVTVGRDISVEELRRFYDAIIFASGAQTDRRLGIPGENLLGSTTATEFVAWYSGHPAYRERQFDLSHETAVVVGQGNVAMDVVRILCKTTEELKNTDITAYAWEALSKSKIKTVHLIGRRGPVQAAFTPAEMKEMGELLDCDPIVDPKDLELNPESQKELEDKSVPIRKKNLEILKEYAKRSSNLSSPNVFIGDPSIAPSGFPTKAFGNDNSGIKPKNRKFIVHFFKGPKELRGNARVEKVVLEKNKLSGPAGAQQAAGTGVTEEIPCGIFFRSVGYRGVPIPGVPFDEKKGIFPNIQGRITDQRKVVPGLYAAGWIKRGPSGVIGTNKLDSEETVKNLLADLATLPACSQPDTPAVLNFLKSKNVKVISFADWKKIDAAEIAKGKALGKPREKFVTVEEMLKVI